ncbi:MAG: CotH kinase family protein [Eubacterium sp.]|nr:CotH kinase family protein [Eubacterium sp.]
MITHRYITRIVVVIVAIMFCLCLAAILFYDKLAEAFGGTAVAMEYESELFNTEEIIDINILIDEEDWEAMLESAMEETYYECDVEINGETFYRVGVRPKGNTSLMSIAGDPDTDRCSLKLEFDQYVDGQTCYGLDKLVLNNNYADATNMKEALIYDMYAYLDADASLYNYAKISVNGEYWGIYLALEAVEDSFMLRNYGTEDGELYKPESMGMGGDNADFNGMSPPDNAEGGVSGSFSFENGELPEDLDTSQFGNTTPPDAAGDGGMTDMEGFDVSDLEDFGGFSLGGDGADLNYTDDDLDSYATIWEGEVTTTTESDHKRVVKALKNISEGNELEKYMDVDNILKYMAVHVFSVNDDSLSGMMAHNYYLYEDDGQLNILPWDYNLAFGGMSGMGGTDNTDSATSVVNDPIDNAFSGTEFFDTLMENEEYRQKYYDYLQQLVDAYIDGGGFDDFYNRIRSQIDSLVETDPTAFYSYDEYQTAAQTLYEVVKLRGQSIDGQLDGTIPTTASEQRNFDALIDASHLDLSVMGSMSMGDMMGGGNADNAATASPDVSQASASGGFDFSQLAGGEPPEGFDPSQFDGQMPGGAQDSTDTGDGSQSTPPDNPQGGGFSGGGQGQGGVSPGGSANTTLISNLVTYGLCLVLLAAAMLFALKYRRRRY